MGVSFCKCKLPVFLYFPCINKLKTDRFVSSQPQQDKVVSVENNSDNNNNVVSVEEKEEPDLVVASVEEKTPENDDEQEEVNCEEEEKDVVVLKSCLKKEGCIEKRNVKWMDLVGKELVEIQEFEPVELEEEERDIGNTTCLWFFQ